MANEMDDLIEYEIARLADKLKKEGVVGDVLSGFLGRVRGMMSRVANAAAGEGRWVVPDSKSAGEPLGIIEPLPEYEISYSPRHLSGIIDAVMRSAYRLGRGDDA